MNPLTKPFTKWDFCPRDLNGNLFEETSTESQNKSDDADSTAALLSQYKSTAIGINLREPESAVVVLEVATGQGREVDETFARFLLDAVRTKNESDLLLQRASEFLDKHKKQQNWYFHGPLSDQVPEALAKYEQLAENHMAGVKHWRDDMVVYLRALAMSAEMVGNATTHGEKAARLRGHIEMIESTVQKCREQQFDFNLSWWRAPDVFRSDFPVLHYLRQNREKDQRIQELERELAAARGENPPADNQRRRRGEASSNDSDDYNPFADE